MSNHRTAWDIVARVESHCGESIKNRRLRLHIIDMLQREIDAKQRLEGNIRNVLSGDKTYDPDCQKAIALSRREE